MGEAALAGQSKAFGVSGRRVRLLRLRGRRSRHGGADWVV